MIFFLGEICMKNGSFGFFERRYSIGKKAFYGQDKNTVVKTEISKSCSWYTQVPILQNYIFSRCQTFVATESSENVWTFDISGSANRLLRPKRSGNFFLIRSQVGWSQGLFWSKKCRPFRSCKLRGLDYQLRPSEARPTQVPILQNYIFSRCQTFDATESSEMSELLIFRCPQIGYCGLRDLGIFF